MTGKGRKQEPPLHIDMDFGEALARFAKTDPKEVADLVEKSRQKKPPETKPPGRPSRTKRGEDKP